MLGKSYKVATDELLIADVHGFNEVDRQANAQLIASAPDMYELLYQIEKIEPLRGNSDFEVLLYNVRKILAKAEGNI